MLLVFALFLYNLCMRIIAGKYKGKKLVDFDLSTTRPTSDMIREALFDKIGYKVIDSTFLDLFAGTGACGIEAISRGAQYVYFVDANKNATNIIKKNMQSIQTTNFEILQNDYILATKTFAKQNLQFDIVFLDPPYASDFAENSIELLNQNNLLKNDFLIVWEHDKTKLQYIENTYPNAKTKKYGEKFLTYLTQSDL